MESGGRQFEKQMLYHLYRSAEMAQLLLEKVQGRHDNTLII